MRDRCRIQMGFFVLRDCGAEARVQCSLCQRPVCDLHVASRGATAALEVLCQECEGRTVEHANHIFRLRLDFYHRHDYFPIYWASEEEAGRHQELLQSTSHIDYREFNRSALLASREHLWPRGDDYGGFHDS